MPIRPQPLTFAVVPAAGKTIAPRSDALGADSQGRRIGRPNPGAVVCAAGSVGRFDPSLHCQAARHRGRREDPGLQRRFISELIGIGRGCTP